MILLRAFWQPVGIFGWAAMIVIVMALYNYDQDTYLHLATRLLILEWLRQVATFYLAPLFRYPAKSPRYALKIERANIRRALKNWNLLRLQGAILSWIWQLGEYIAQFPRRSWIWQLGHWTVQFPRRFSSPKGTSAPSRARVWTVGIFSLLVPPFGVLYWLLMDGKQRRVARLAGRNAVRGALMLSVVGWAALINWEVNIAIHAIHLAVIQPVDEAKVERIVAQKKNLRRQKLQKFSARRA